MDTLDTTLFCDGKSGSGAQVHLVVARSQDMMTWEGGRGGM